MSAIIKSGGLADAAQIRPIAAVTAAARTRADEERERFLARIAALEGDVRRRDDAIAQLQTDVISAREAGEAEGRLTGYGEAEDRQAERLALLERNIGEARQALSGSLKSLERLAPLLARECLEIILGRAEDRVEFLSRIVGVQMDRIEKGALLAVELSRADFPDDASLAAFVERAELPAVVLSTGDLPPGGCVLSLRLGHMNVGLQQQWNVLRDVLGEMALPGGEQ